MEANDDRVAAALGGSVLAPSGSDLVLAEWRDPGGATDPPTYVAPLHTYWNVSPEPARYLLVMTARIAALTDAIHRLQSRDQQALKQVFEDHDSELLAWP